MKNITSGYPNPVLGVGDDVAGEFDVNVRLEWLVDEQEIQITLGYFCSDDAITSLISRKKVEFIALCRCGSTLSTWILQEGVNRLSWSMIRDKFSITPYLIARENIEAYHSQNFAPIFAEVTFNIERGAVLAVAGDKVFDLNPIETNRVLKSLFHFQDYAGNIIDYELERNTIAIKIPRFGQPQSLKKQLFNFSNWLSVCYSFNQHSKEHLNFCKMLNQRMSSSGWTS